MAHFSFEAIDLAPDDESITLIRKKFAPVTVPADQAEFVQGEMVPAAAHLDISSLIKQTVDATIAAMLPKIREACAPQFTWTASTPMVCTGASGTNSLIPESPPPVAADSTISAAPSDPPAPATADGDNIASVTESPVIAPAAETTVEELPVAAPEEVAPVEPAPTEELAVTEPVAVVDSPVAEVPVEVAATEPAITEEQTAETKPADPTETQSADGSAGSGGEATT